MSFIVFLWLPAIRVVLILNASFIPSRPVVTIESDDWGALRGRDWKQNPITFTRWSKMDCLESIADVKKLTKVLQHHRDARGRTAVITANVVLESIAGDWRNKKIFRRKVPKNIILSWKEAIKAEVFFPQLHAMRESDEQSILNLDASVRLKTSPYMFWNGSAYRDLPKVRVEKVVLEGQELFHGIFGFTSLSTVPPRLLWGKATEIAFFKAGIRYVQGERQVQNRKRSYGQVVGERTRNGLVLLSPRVGFEPAFAWENGKPVDEVVKRKANEILLRLNSNMPVAISTHRINYVSGHSISQAEYGLIALDRLLSNLLRHYPDLIILTSPELGQLLERGYFEDVFTGEMVKIPSLSFWQLILSHWKIGENTKRNILLSALLLITLLVFWLTQFYLLVSKTHSNKKYIFYTRNKG
jgi:hypothetical protein